MQLLTTNVGFENDNAINKMINDLHETISLLNRLHIDTKSIIEIQSELNVLNLFSNRQIVSIAGLQSVGKTSLIKRFLDFPEDLLLSEVGVGEKRPVLISADDKLNDMAYYCVKSIKASNGYNEVKEEKITKNELNQGVQNPPIDVLWYEIKMPRNAKIGSLTLALLPGFERNKQSDSQKFLDLFLNCSTGMILVLNHMRLAQASQHQLLDRVSKAYKEKVPGFVLTFASELDDEKKATITNNLTEQFQIDDKSQIIFSDISDASISDKLEKLIKQNSQYSIDSANLHTNKQLIIGEQLALELMKVENGLKAKHISEEENDTYRFDKRQFNRFKDEYIKLVRETLEQQMQQHVELCQQKVKQSLNNDNATIGSKFKAFFKNELTYKEVHELKEWIRNIYTTDDPYKTNHLLINSIGIATEGYLNKRINVVMAKIEQNQHKLETVNEPVQKITTATSEFGSFDNILFGKNHEPAILESSYDFGNFDELLLATVTKGNEITTIVNSNTEKEQSSKPINKIDFAVNHTLSAVDNYFNIKKDHFNSLSDAELQIIPAIAGSIAQQAIATKTAMDRKDIEYTNLMNIKVFNEQLNGIDGIKNEINNLSMDMNHIVKGAVLFFGVDALDGTFNSFGAITGALEALGLAAGTATTVAVGGVAGIAAAIAIKKGGDKLEKYKFERDQYAQNLLKVTGEFQVEATVQSIEKVFDDIDYQLDMANSYRKNEHSNLTVYNELQIRISRLKKECGILRELAYRNETFINKILPTTI